MILVWTNHPCLRVGHHIGMMLQRRPRSDEARQVVVVQAIGTCTTGWLNAKRAHMRQAASSG
jgi:hypothetical protein